MRTTILAVLDLALGCTNAAPLLGDSYTVAIDKSFTAEERAGIEASINDWRSRVPVTLDIADMACDSLTPSVICIRAVGHAEVLRQCGANALPTTLDCTVRADSDGSIVYLDAARYGGQDVWKYAVTHELGHAMGLKHDHDGTVMCWDVTCGSVDVADDDAAQWTRLRQ